MAELFGHLGKSEANRPHLLFYSTGRHDAMVSGAHAIHR